MSRARDAQGRAAGLLSQAEAPFRAWSSRRLSVLHSLFPLALAILMPFQSTPHTFPRVPSRGISLLPYRPGKLYSSLEAQPQSPLLRPQPPKGGPSEGLCTAGGARTLDHGPSGASICGWGRDLRPHSLGSIEKTQLSNHTFGALWVRPCAPPAVGFTVLPGRWSSTSESLRGCELRVHLWLLRGFRFRCTWREMMEI